MRRSSFLRSLGFFNSSPGRRARLLFSGLSLIVAFGAVIPAVVADQTTDHSEGLHSNPPNVWAITAAKVVVSPETTLPKATIVVRSGKIEAVGPDVQIPADARVIDGQGKTIYAGLIDAYAEQSVSSDALMKTARYWNNNVTPQLTVAGQLEAIGSTGVSLRKQGVVARLIAPADGVIRGRSVLVALTDGPVNTQLVLADVAQHLELTVARRSRSGYPGSPMGAVALARQALYDAQWYRDAWNAARADAALPRPETNDALAALLPVLDGQMPVVIKTSDELFLQRADRYAAEFGLNVIIRGSGREYRRLAEVKAAGRPLILPVAFPTAPNVATREAADDVSLESLMHWDLAPENPARVAEAGLRFAFTSDRLSSSDTFLKSLRKAVARGLSSSDALRALTVTPADLFQVSHQLGTVQTGRLASFVMTDGDLFDNKTKILETWVAGQRFQHVTEPVHKVDGQFQLALNGDEKLPGQLFLEIVQKGDQVSGRVSRSAIPGRAADKDSEKEDQTPDGEPEKESPAAAEDERPPQADSNEQSHEEKSATTEAATDSSADPPTDESQKDGGEKSTKENKENSIIKLQNVRLADGLLTASWNSGDWKLPGIARITLVITQARDQETEQPAAVGTIIWPSGVQVTAIATRTQAPESSEADNSKDSADSEAVAKDSQATVADVASDVPAKAAADSGNKADDQAAPADPSAEESADQSAKKELTTSDSARPDASSFPVNYPLGAFGRPQIPQPRLAAFVHATLWTCGPAGVIQDGTLLIQDGRIVAAGRDVEIPKEAEIHDVQGMHISPGLIDCHSHAATDGGVNESTQAITCEVRIGDFIDSDDITIYRQLAGGVTTANILHGSANPIGGQNQVIKLRWGMNGEQMKFAEAPPGVKFALGENVKQSNWSQPTGRYPQTRMGVEQIYRDAFQAARDYATKMDAWQTERRGLPPRRNLELDALREIIEGKRWIHCHSYRQDEILALLRILDEYKITIGTFQHILEGYKVADAMVRHGAMASAFSDWWAYKMEVQDAIPYAGALMHSAGVVVSFNSDDGELARHLNQEAAKAIKYGGVSREEALKFVTLNPAKQLRIDAYVGSLEPDKHADFVVWNGDPLSNFSRCEQTWIDGRPFFTRREDDDLRSQAEAMRNTLIQKVLKSGQKMKQDGEGDADPAAMWPRFDEFCRHIEYSRQIRMLEQQQLDNRD